MILHCTLTIQRLRLNTFKERTAVTLLCPRLVCKVTITSAISALSRHDESRWAMASETALVISARATLTVVQLTLVDILASASLLRESGITVALVSVLGVDALPVSANVRTQRALVYRGDRLQLLQAEPVVIVYN